MILARRIAVTLLIIGAIDVFLSINRPAAVDAMWMVYACQSAVYSQFVLLSIWLAIGKTTLLLRIAAACFAVTLLAAILPTRIWPIDISKSPVASWSPFDCSMHLDYSPATTALLALPVFVLVVVLARQWLRPNLTTRGQFSLLELGGSVAFLTGVLACVFTIPVYDANLALVIAKLVSTTERDSFLLIQIPLPAIEYSVVGYLATMAARTRRHFLAIQSVGPSVVGTIHVNTMLYYHNTTLSLVGIQYFIKPLIAYHMSYLAVLATLAYLGVPREEQPNKRPFDEGDRAGTGN